MSMDISSGQLYSAAWVITSGFFGSAVFFMHVINSLFLRNGLMALLTSVSSLLALWDVGTVVEFLSSPLAASVRAFD